LVKVEGLLAATNLDNPNYDVCNTDDEISDSQDQSEDGHWATAPCPSPMNSVVQKLAFIVDFPCLPWWLP
jgi:hypothetical protein